MKLSPKIRHISGFILFILFIITFTGCDSNSNVIAPPLNLSVPDSMLNKDLRVTAPANWNDFKKEEDFITFEITLATNKEIVTQPDFNAEIYLYDDAVNEWKEIENLGNYVTPPDQIFLHQGDVKGLAVLPDLSGASASQNNVLILVSGNVIENGVKTDKIIGTYIILKLKP